MDTLGSHLQRTGHEVLLVFPWSEEEIRRGESKLGFPCYRMRLRPPFERERPIRSSAAFALRLPGTVRRIIGLIRQHDIDIVNVHYPERSSLHYALAALWTGVPLVVSVHGTDAFPAGTPEDGRPASVDFVLRAAESIVSPSETYADWLRQSLSADRTRVVVVPNGVDVGTPGVARESIDAAGLVDNGGPLELVSVGRLTRDKGHATLIRALRELVEGGLEARLEIVGEGPDRDALEALAERQGVGRRVTFAGGREHQDVVATLREKDLFVVASRAESFGLAVVEAMAVGLPVVATSVGGLPEVVVDGETGILVDPRDPTALALALRKMAADPLSRRRMGARGAERVREKFLARHMASGYEAEYRRVTGEPSSHSHAGQATRPAPEGATGPR